MQPFKASPRRSNPDPICRALTTRFRQSVPCNWQVSRGSIRAEAWTWAPIIPALSALGCMPRRSWSAAAAALRLCLCWLSTLRLLATQPARLLPCWLLVERIRSILAAISFCWVWLAAAPHRVLWRDGLCIAVLLAAAALAAAIPAGDAASAPEQPWEPWVSTLRHAAFTAAILQLFVLLLSYRSRARVQQHDCRQLSFACPAGGCKVDSRTAGWAGGCGSGSSSGSGAPAQQSHGAVQGVTATVDCGWKRCRASLSNEALSPYATALWVTQPRPYSPVVQSVQMHLRLGDLQPEQLAPGWRTGLEEHLAAQGWSILNAAVRRGSICISLSLACLRRPAPAPPCTGSGSSPGSPRDCALASSGGYPWTPGARTGSLDGAPPSSGGSVAPPRWARAPRSPPSPSGTAAAALVVPEDLLAGLGLQREDLPPGASFTVQAVADNGLCQRIGYTLLPDGNWALEPLHWREGGDGSPSARHHLAGSSCGDAPTEQLQRQHQEQHAKQQEGQLQQHPLATARDWEDASNLAAAGLPPERCCCDDENNVERSSVCSSDASRQASGSGAGSCVFGSRGATSDGSGASPAVAVVEPLRWQLCAPLVLVGVQEPERARILEQEPPGANFCGTGVQRYDAQVWGGPAAPDCADCEAAGDAFPVGEAPFPSGPWDAHGLEFRARPLDVSGRVAELRVQSVPVTLPLSLSLRQRAPAAASSSAIPGGPLLGRVPFRQVSAGDMPSKECECGCGHEREFDCRGGGSGRGRTCWAVMLWDAPPPAVTVPQPPESKTPPPSTRQQYSSSTGDSAPAGTQGGTGRRMAAAGGQAAAAAATAAAGPRSCIRLVDLSLWRGHELLAARVLLLVPSPSPDGGDGSSRRRNDPWVGELRALLRLLPSDAQQHVLTDLGLLLSGALSGAAAGEAERVAGAVGGRRAGARSAQQRLLLTLDLGCNLLSLVLKHGACGLAAELWAALEGMGFGAEEVLLHAAGMTEDVPPLHAAVVSGQPRAVSLVLGWYAAARLTEPWLQPLAFPGAPAVLTPLVLASAASPPGHLLSYILRSHPQALAVWRTSVNGASARATAAAAGLRRVVLAADLWTLGSVLGLQPLWAAAAASASWCRQPFRGAIGRWWAACSPASGAAAPAAAARHKGTVGATATCSSAAATASATATAVAVAATAVIQRRLFPGRWCGVRPTSAAARRDAAPCWPLAAAQPGKLGAGKAGRAGGVLELDMLVAQRTRTQTLLLQCAIIVFQVVAQIKALAWAFEATCPAAAAVAASEAVPFALARLRFVHALVRCLAGRYWWTSLEVGVAAALASPLGLRHYTACCAVAAALRCMFQAGEGVLLPPSGMAATGGQMLLASFLFVLATAYGFQPSSRVNVLLRLAEGLAASRLYVKYCVTSYPALAVVQALTVNCLGWWVSAILRARTERALRWEVGRRAREPSVRSPKAGELRRSPQLTSSSGDGASGSSSAGPKGKLT